MMRIRADNKKILNATKIINTNLNISFKSKLEENIYKTLRSLNIDVEYEPTTFTLWEGFSPKTPFYDKESDTQYHKRGSKGPRRIVLKNNNIIGIRYTPDFYFNYKGVDVWIEAKGFENDVFYIKKKMFIKYLDNLLVDKNQQSIYFEIYSKNQLLQALNIIKEYVEVKGNQRQIDVPPL